MSLDVELPVIHLTEIHRDCVGGVMGLGDLGGNLAIVGAELIKSRAYPVTMRTRAELTPPRVHDVRLL